MIHVDMEEELVEFEGNGETILKEIALLLCMNLHESMEDEKCPLPKEMIPEMVEFMMEMLKAMVLGGMEGVDSFYEEEDVQEERSVKEIRTTVKQFRKGRPS